LIAMMPGNNESLAVVDGVPQVGTYQLSFYTNRIDIPYDWA